MIKHIDKDTMEFFAVAYTLNGMKMPFEMEQHILNCSKCFKRFKFISEKVYYGKQLNKDGIIGFYKNTKNPDIRKLIAEYLKKNKKTMNIYVMLKKIDNVLDRG